MGLQRERECVGSDVTFYPQDTGDKSRHQRICLAAASIGRKMDNWTLLSAGFDVGEEADGGSRTTATPWDRGGAGMMHGIGGEKWERAQEKKRR